MADNIILQLCEGKIEDLQEQFNDILKSLTPTERLIQAIDVIATSATMEEKAIVATYTAWTYIKKEELWKSQYISLEALEKELDRDFSIKRTLKSYIHMTSRQESEIRSIMRHWGDSPIKIFPREMLPPWIGHALLTALNRLSKIESRETTLPLLRQAIQDRKARPKTRKSDHLVVGDVNSVICQLESRRERVESATQAMELPVLHQGKQLT